MLCTLFCVMYSVCRVLCQLENCSNRYLNRDLNHEEGRVGRNSKADLLFSLLRKADTVCCASDPQLCCEVNRVGRGSAGRHGEHIRDDVHGGHGSGEGRGRGQHRRHQDSGHSAAPAHAPGVRHMSTSIFHFIFSHSS